MKQQRADPAFAAVHPEAPLLSDPILVERARNGDAAAFELIMRRYNRRLYRLARSILRNGAEAEDVVQDAYVRAYEKLDGFVGPTGFSAWLCRIATNEALGRLRRRGRVVLLDDYARGADGAVGYQGIESIMSQQPDPERLAANGELRRLLEVAIDALPDDFRAVFVLRAVEGMSLVETAECLSIRPETVKTRFHRARLLLQAALGARFETLMPSVFAFGGEHCDRIVEAVMIRLRPAFASSPPDTVGSAPRIETDPDEIPSPHPQRKDD